MTDNEKIEAAKEILLSGMDDRVKIEHAYRQLTVGDFPARPAWCPQCWYSVLSSKALSVRQFEELTRWASALYDGVDKEEIKAFVDAVERRYHEP